MDDLSSEVSTDEIRETNFLFQEKREKIPVDREDSIPTPSPQEETLAPPATPATPATPDNVQTSFDEIDYDNIELKKTLKEDFHLMKMKDYFEVPEIQQMFIEIKSEKGTVNANILENQMTRNDGSYLDIERPYLKLSCYLVNLSKRPAKRDLTIGIIQLSERKMLYSYGDIKEFHEFYSHLVHDQKYVLDRCKYPHPVIDSVVHPFYHERSFCKIKRGEIPPKTIELIVEDFPSAKVNVNIDGRDLVDFERKQRFPVFIVIDESDDDNPHNYRVLHSFEWMLLSRWHRDIDQCKVTEIHRSGIITGSKPDLGQFDKTFFNNPVCNQWQIFYTLNTENNILFLYPYSNMNQSEINNFEANVKRKLRAKHEIIKSVVVNVMPLPTNNDNYNVSQIMKSFHNFTLQ